MNKYIYLTLFFFFVAKTTMYCQNTTNDKLSFQKTITFSDKQNKDAAISLFLKDNNLDNLNTFQSKPATIDVNGIEHQRHQQYYKGIPVEFGTIISHGSSAQITSINGELYNAKGLNVVPKFTKQQCLNLAIASVGASKYLWEDEAQAQILGYSKPTGELVIFPIVTTGKVKIAYKYDIYSIDPISRIEVYVDGVSGAILYKNPIIKHANEIVKNIESDLLSKRFSSLVLGNAATKYSGQREIETTLSTGINRYILNDLSRGGGIFTYNCERKPKMYQDENFVDNDNNWTAAEHANNFFDDAALDAHWGAEKTYDFWKNIFNRNSYDGNNAPIRSYVHYREATFQSYNNAFWNGSAMTYGDGNSKPLTSIDICGHEIGHAVCTFTANLAYQNQSGALNEGFSDIWGACVEQYGRTGSLSGAILPEIWQIGEDIQSDGGLRSMASPNLKEDPDTFQGDFWKTTADEGSCVPDRNTNDYCGVHSNSGVLNHWFYILTSGKSGTNNAPTPDSFNVAGIGMAKAAQIAYFAERDYLTPNATFFDLRAATIAIAKANYGCNSAEVIAVTDAWAAVNIGEKFVSFNDDVALKTLPSSINVSCASTSLSAVITFENTGLNPINSINIIYNIDGGANQNLVWTGNLPSCSSGTYQLVIDTQSLSGGNHFLNVSTSFAGDQNVANNSKTTLISKNYLGQNNQLNTFESVSDALISYNELSSDALWVKGISAKTTLTNTIAGNSNIYTTNLNGTYTDKTKAYLVTPCYDLSRLVNPVLKFDMAFDLEQDFDVIYMQYSIDNGNSWNALGSASDSNWYNSSNGACANCIGGQWTGEAEKPNPNGGRNGTKRQYSQSLAQFGSSSSNPRSNIIFRYVFNSDEAVNEDGAIIDNFVIEGTLSNNNETVFNKLSIYPNPADTQINIAMLSELNETLKVSLYDLQGRLIKNVSFEAGISTINESIDIATIPSGFYILKLNQGTLNYNTKIIKK